MIFDDKPLSKDDFKRIYTKANEVLVASNVIAEFPFNIKGLIREMSDINICSYSKAKQNYGLKLDTFKSDDAEIKEMRGMHIIFYNDNEIVTRKRYSLVHEFSHYILGHKLDLDRDNPLYQKQEIEANCCAAQILMPEQIIRVCQKRNYVTSEDFISKSFGVSGEAASKRRKSLAKYEYEWRSRSEKEFDDIILDKYASYINSIAPKKRDAYDFEEELESQRRRDSWYAESGRR